MENGKDCNKFYVFSMFYNWHIFAIITKCINKGMINE